MLLDPTALPGGTISSVLWSALCSMPLSILAHGRFDSPMECSTTNGTLHSDRDASDYVYIAYYFTFLCLISVVGILGNAAILISMVMHPRLATPRNYFTASLAVSDLLQGFFYPSYNTGHIEVPEIMHTIGEHSQLTQVVQ